MTRKGLISIGTNSTRALVAELNGDAQILLHRSTGTRLGEGLRQSGHLQDDAIHRTLEAVASHTAAVRELTASIEAIATSAVRRADNAGEFVARVHQLTGAALHTISGVEEARASYAGAISGLPKNDSYGVVDIGGGSTEYATAGSHASCEIGAVRLTELFPILTAKTDPGTLEAVRAIAREALAPLRLFDRVHRLVFVGGSATTIMAIAQRGAIGEYGNLDRGESNDTIAQLARLELEQRKKLPGMVAQRADILLAGAVIVDETFAITGHENAIVSQRDLLLGYLLTH